VCFGSDAKLSPAAIRPADLDERSRISGKANSPMSEWKRIDRASAPPPILDSLCAAAVLPTFRNAPAKSAGQSKGQSHAYA